MKRNIPCPRCGQDWLQRIVLTPMNRPAVLCQECDALWLGDAGKNNWIDLSSFMEQYGIDTLSQPDVYKVVEPLLDE